MKKTLIILGVGIVGLIFTSCQSSQTNDNIGTENNLLLENEFHVPVTVKQIKPEMFEHFIEVSGSIEAMQDAFISPEMSGRIKAIYVEEGQYVEAGQVLAELNTSITRKGIEEVKTALGLAEITYEKQKELWDQKIGSEMQFLQMKNAKESLEKKLETLEAQVEMAKVKAPFSGIVDIISQKEGELGTPGFQMIRMVNMSKIKVLADVSESYLSKMKKGDTVIVTVPSYPEIKLKSPIHRIGNVINPDNRTVKVEVRVPNSDNILKPNMIAELLINDIRMDSVVVIPSVIVKQDLSKGAFVFVAEEVDGKLKAKKRNIKTGISWKNNTIVTSGLENGDKVITEGYNLVSNGSLLNSIE